MSHQFTTKPWQDDESTGEFFTHCKGDTYGEFLCHSQIKPVQDLQMGELDIAHKSEKEGAATICVNSGLHIGGKRLEKKFFQKFEVCKSLILPIFPHL